MYEINFKFRKSRSTTQSNSEKLANNFNEYFTSLGSSTAAVVCGIAKENKLETIYEQALKTLQKFSSMFTKFPNKKL